MKNKTSQVQEMSQIANLLAGKINLSSIKKSQQILMGEEYQVKSVNDLLFVKKMYGLYFYTSKYSLEMMCELKAGIELPILVCLENSTNLYEISK